jgi:hypothetical protein
VWVRCSSSLVTHSLCVQNQVLLVCMVSGDRRYDSPSPQTFLHFPSVFPTEPSHQGPDHPTHHHPTLYGLSLSYHHEVADFGLVSFL